MTAPDTMQLIGMLDSPYVRRVAVSLHVMGIRFEHRAVSVFSTFEQFRAINPVVKAPSLVCDDGEVLMDSTLILDYADALAPQRSLMPRDTASRQHALRIVGLEPGTVLRPAPGLRDVLLTGKIKERIIHIGDVLHITHRLTTAQQVAIDQVKREIRSRVAQMRGVIRRDAADVHGGGIARDLHRLDRGVSRVIQTKGLRSAGDSIDVRCGP